MNSKPQEYYQDAGISFRRKDKPNPDEYQRFNEDFE